MPAPGRATGSSRTEYVVDRDDPAERHPLEAVRLLAPVQPRKFLAIGLNYADHIAESGMEAPQFPVFFNKQITCVVGPDDDVHMPRVSNLLDYEGELAIVIGDALPPRARGPRARGDRRLHDHQRRLGPRLAGAHADDDDGQVVRHARAARPVARHRGRARRPARPLDSGPTSTTSCARTATRGEMIYNCYQQVAHLSRGVHARARRRDRHRHAGRDRRRAPAVPRRTAQGRRRRADRDRRDRRAAQHRGRGARRVTSCRRRGGAAWAH